MAEQNRRQFLKALGVGAACFAAPGGLLLPRDARATPGGLVVPYEPRRVYSFASELRVPGIDNLYRLPDWYGKVLPAFLPPVLVGGLIYGAIGGRA